MWTKYIDEEGDPFQSSRLTRLDVVVFGLQIASVLVSTVAELIDVARHQAMCHYNADIDQRTFAAEAAQEIERIVGGHVDASPTRRTQDSL
jgi:hypothetical protein